MNIRYHVELTQAERCELTALVSSGKRPVRKLKRAQILLAAEAGFVSLVTSRLKNRSSWTGSTSSRSMHILFTETRRKAGR